MFRGAVVLVALVALYLLSPSLIEVFSSWDQIAQLEFRWLLLVGAAQVTAWCFVWAIQRMALRTDSWLPVVTSQLAGNAASRVIPGGGAAGLALQFQMLRRSGVDTSTAGVGLAAVGLIQFATLLGLPVFALPGLLAVPPVEQKFLSIAVSALVFFLAVLVLALVALTSDRLIRWIGRGVDVLRHRMPILHPPQQPTAVGLSTQRDLLKNAFGARWARAIVYAVGRATFDFLSLLAAIAALGIESRPALVLLAFATASWLGMIPITPGGLGFVEAGLGGLLVLSGVPAVEAVSVTFLYRLFSFWLPIPVGLAAGAIHRFKYRKREVTQAGGRGLGP